MKEKHLAALIRRNHDFFDSLRDPLNAGKHNASFFGARFAAVAGATPMLSLQSSVLHFQKTPQLQNAKGIFFRKVQSVQFFYLHKNGCVFLFFHII